MRARPRAAAARAGRPAADGILPRWRDGRGPRTPPRGPARARAASAPRRAGSLRSPLRDVACEAVERAEDAQVFLVVVAQLEAVALRDDQGDLEDVDGVQPEALAVERRFRVDVLGLDLQV